jgi:CheY-like chemotaxis protein/HPt (histidine-containing phosphotransfer) domain-containing protein
MMPACVLVAEDDRMSRLLMTEQLQLLGFEAEFATNGIEALARWRDGGIATLLTDLQMPGMDGYALTQAIRREEAAGVRTPIIALTANTPDEGSKRWSDAGMDGHLTKPVELATLEATLERWSGSADAADAAVVSEAQPADAAPVDLQVLAGMIGRDPATLSSFLADFERTLAEGAAAIERELELGYPQRAGAIAHRLKASARAVGSFRLGRHCAAIEAAAAQGDGSALASARQRFRAELALVQRWIGAHAASGAG